jgi:hypothetical protein
MKIILSVICFFVGLQLNAQQTNNSQIDSRIKLHYSDAQIAEMDAVKLVQVKFIYTQSYRINQDKPCPECPAIDHSKIDVSKLKRNAKTVARHYQTVPGHPIDLMSYEQLDAELTRIAQELSTNNNQH